MKVAWAETIVWVSLDANCAFHEKKELKTRYFCDCFHNVLVRLWRENQQFRLVELARWDRFLHLIGFFWRRWYSCKKVQWTFVDDYSNFRLILLYLCTSWQLSCAICKRKTRTFQPTAHKHLLTRSKSRKINISI